MTDYSFTALVVDIICIVCILSIYFCVNLNVGTNFELFIIKGLLIDFIIYLIINAIWAMNECHIIRLDDSVYEMSMLLDILVITIESAFWCAYSTIRENRRDSFNKKELFIISFPVIFQIILMIIAVIFPFGRNENGKIRYYIFNYWLTIAVLFYITVSFRNFIRKYKRANSWIKKARYRKNFFLLQPAVIGFLLEAIFKMQFIVAFGFYLSIFLMFINLQQSNIYTDALTDVSNRRAWEEYLHRVGSSVNEKNSLFIFLIDIDNFKFLNDKYGHLMGDLVLSRMGRGLNNLNIRYDTFVSRIGGDEFAIAVFQNKIENPEKFCREIRISVRNEWKKLDIPLQAEISIGYHFCDSTKMVLSDGIMKADKMMYAVKKEHHKMCSYEKNSAL